MCPPVEYFNESQPIIEFWKKIKQPNTGLG